MLEVIGWIGSICFAVCGLPQAWKSYKDGHSEGVSWGFLLLWLVGEVLCLIYVIPSHKWPLVFNYVINLIFLLIIIKYKLRPKTKVQPDHG